MTNSLVRRCGGVLLAVLFVAPTFAARDAVPDVVRGRVVGVSDGDTITVLTAAHRQEKIRLAGIDAPERRQPFSSRSKENLSRLTFRKQVEVLVTKADHHDRLVGKVVVGDGIDVSLKQLKAGLAWFYTDYQEELTPTDRSAYSSAARTARTSRVGLWSESGAMPPWQFRRNLRSAGRRHAHAAAVAPQDEGTAIIGNRRSRTYHLPDCPNWSAVDAVVLDAAADAGATSLLTLHPRHYEHLPERIRIVGV